MSKLSKFISGFKILLKYPYLVNKLLQDDLVWQDKLSAAHNGIKSLPVLEINDLIPNFNVDLNTFAFLDGGSLPTDLALLKGLAASIEDCSYFEIGTWRGESVINVADVAKECFTLNLSHQEILELGLPRAYADLHGHFSKGKSNIQHLEGNSLTFDYAGLNQKFDLIFIDGNHEYEFVKSDTEKVFENLVHEKTIVVWHDYAYNPVKPRPEVFNGILDGTPKEFHSNLYHVSNSMCAIFTKQKLPTTELISPSKPTKVFEIGLKTKSI